MKAVASSLLLRFKPISESGSIETEKRRNEVVNMVLDILSHLDADSFVMSPGSERS